MRKLFAHMVLFYLRFFARLALRLHTPTVIGIAGSVGKSSTRNALYALLKDHYKTRMVYGNSETGIPLGILGISQHGFSPTDWLLSLMKAPFGIFYLHKTKYLIVEMGIDEPLPPKNMSYLLSIVRPHIALSLNVSATHTQQFEVIIPKNKLFSTPKEKRDYLIDKIAEEDTKIISKGKPRLAIINADDSRIMRALSDYITVAKRPVQTFGKHASNTIWYKDYQVTLEGTTFSFQKADEALSLNFKKLLLPKEYQELFAAVILVGRYLSLPTEKIVSSLERNFHLPLGRGSLFAGIRDSLIIDSSYNASKEAVIAFLSLAQKLKEQTSRPIVFLFGDMRELGEESEIEHQEVTKEISKYVDYLYCVGKQTKQFVLPALATENTHTLIEYKWFPSATAAGKYVKTSLPEKSIVLVKGSQNTIFLEEAIKYILKNQSDEKKLCRQEAYWRKLKAPYLT